MLYMYVYILFFLFLMYICFLFFFCCKIQRISFSISNRILNNCVNKCVTLTNLFAGGAKSLLIHTSIPPTSPNPLYLQIHYIYKKKDYEGIPRYKYPIKIKPENKCKQKDTDTTLEINGTKTPFGLTMPFDNVILILYANMGRSACKQASQGVLI